MEGIETAMSEMEIVQDTHDPTVGAPNRPTIQDGQPSFDSGIQQPSQHDASEDVPSIKFAIDLVEDLVEGMCLIYQQLGSFSTSFLQIYQLIWKFTHTTLPLTGGQNICTVSTKHFLLLRSSNL